MFRFRADRVDAKVKRVPLTFLAHQARDHLCTGRESAIEKLLQGMRGPSKSCWLVIGYHVWMTVEKKPF